VQGLAQSPEPSQAEPKWAGPSLALGHGLVTALAWLRNVKAVSLRLRPHQINPSNQRCALQRLRSLLLSAQKVGWYKYQYSHYFFTNIICTNITSTLRRTTTADSWIDGILLTLISYILFSGARRPTMITTTVNNSTTNNKKKVPTRR
jgi:hypothetical protein